MFDAPQQKELTGFATGPGARCSLYNKLHQPETQRQAHRALASTSGTGSQALGGQPFATRPRRHPAAHSERSTSGAVPECSINLRNRAAGGCNVFCLYYATSSPAAKPTGPRLIQGSRRTARLFDRRARAS